MKKLFQIGTKHFDHRHALVSCMLSECDSPLKQQFPLMGSPTQLSGGHHSDTGEFSGLQEQIHKNLKGLLMTRREQEANQQLIKAKQIRISGTVQMQSLTCTSVK